MSAFIYRITLIAVFVTAIEFLTKSNGFQHLICAGLIAFVIMELNNRIEALEKKVK